MIKRLDSLFFTVELRLNIFKLYEICGKFGKAEDILFELLGDEEIIDLDKRKDILDEGIGFYERLLEKEDNDLLKGNLPRNEILEGLEVLKRKTNNI